MLATKGFHNRRICPLENHCIVSLLKKCNDSTYAQHSCLDQETVLLAEEFHLLFALRVQ
jgi:hypothetical protein